MNFRPEPRRNAADYDKKADFSPFSRKNRSAARQPAPESDDAHAVRAQARRHPATGLHEDDFKARWWPAPTSRS